MSAAAYLVTMKVGGDSVFSPNSPDASILTRLDDRTFQISDENRRIIAPDELQPTVYLGGVERSPEEYRIDYLSGIVTFTDAAAGDCTLSYYWIPTLEVGGAENFTLNLGCDLMDDTSFDQTNKNGGYRTRRPTLIDASLTISQFTSFESNPELAQPFIDRLFDRERVVIEIIPASGGNIRGWFRLESNNSSGGVSDLENQDLSFQLDNLSNANFTWRTT